MDDAGVFKTSEMKNLEVNILHMESFIKVIPGIPCISSHQSLLKLPLSVRLPTKSGLKTMSVANFFKEAKAAALQ